jgi:UDP-4-amino-4-deoxy-L-arabinose formyltransferase/UDP-glucuronic acid dehydrogenase (UDP-4-keto-hexauronic acid decarboxylating)
MKTVVLAYHNIGCAGIEALLQNGFEIAAVFSHTDDLHENIWFESVAEIAAIKNIPVFAPININHPIWVRKIKEIGPDIIFSFHYRRNISQTILDIPKMGCLSLRASLLPKYRGKCPINWVLVNGEKETGVTLHYLTTNLDDGDIVCQDRIEISDTDTAKLLHEKAAKTASKMLDNVLPRIKDGTASRVPQDHSKATCYGPRCPEDGQIDWSLTATQIRNLVRAVTHPYPGAFSYVGEKKYYFWAVTELSDSEAGLNGSEKRSFPGTIISTDPLVVTCGKGTIRMDFGQREGGIYMNGARLAKEFMLIKGTVFGKPESSKAEAARKKSVLILGVNGFIGNALSEKLLESGKYEVHGLDLWSSNIKHLLGNPDFHFDEGNISVHREWIEYHIRKCDVVIPLVAIATPSAYTRDPLRVFELDFEENLRVIRYCAKYQKRIIFPSTSEVYGMCDEETFDEDNSKLVLGPIRMQRWIYSCSKQLLDRVIWACGQQGGLRFSLIRPFNWMGPKLDSLSSARDGNSRVITQLILNLVEGSPIQLVDGGHQKRCFTDISDGIECLYRIVENRGGVCDGQIINIGNPDNELSIRNLAEMLVEKFHQHPLHSSFPPFAGIREVESSTYYGSGYQDVQHRKPSIRNAKKLLGWSPKVGIEQCVEQTLDFFMQEAVSLKLSTYTSD